MAKYYYQTESGEFGPLRPTELRVAADSGKLKPQDFIRSEKNPRWYSAARIPGLFATDDATATDPTTLRIDWSDPPEILASVIVEPDLHSVFTDPTPIDTTDAAAATEVDETFETFDFPGAEFAPHMRRPTHFETRRRLVSPFTPREYPLLLFIGCLQELLGWLLLVGVLIVCMLALDHKPHLFTIALALGVGGLSSLTFAYLIYALIDLLDDTKRSADRMENLLELELLRNANE